MNKEKLITISKKTQNYGTKLIEITFLFILSLIFISPLVGTFFALVDFYWGWIAVLITLVLASLLARFIYKLHLFEFSLKSVIVIIGLIIVGIVIYGNYSPALELRQDPSLYMLKALNLVNYGHIYMPMDITKDLIAKDLIGGISDYATLQNGTQYVEGLLNTDFYPGGSFFYAIVGFFSKSRIFYGQTIIAIINVILLYMIICKLTSYKHEIACGFFACGFMVAPLIVWFGRGSFSEPIAMTYFLSIILMLMNDKINNYILMTVLLATFTARIDYLILMVMGIFVISYRNIKDGCIFTALVSIEAIVLSKVYWIYYNRISMNDMKLVKFTIPIFLIVLVVSILIKKYWKKVEIFYHSKVIYYIFGVVFGIVSLLAFRNSISNEFQELMIHGKLLRTYVEEIFDLLFQVFPAIFIVGGLLGIFRFVKNKNLSFVASVFFVGCIAVYSYFFLRAGNSPQLYWMLRRYYNVLMPGLFISFVYLFEKADKQITIIIGLACTIISANQLLDTKQVSDYSGLDKAVGDVSDYLSQNNVDAVFYSADLRYQVSSLMSFSDCEFIKLDTEDDIEKIQEYINEKGLKALVLSPVNFEEMCELNYTGTYYRMGETYGGPPMEAHKKQYKYNLYDFDDYCTYIFTIDEIVYPMWSCFGIYDDNEWLNGETTFYSQDNEKIEIDADNLVITLLDYDQYYIDENRIDDLKLSVTVDGKKLEIISFEKNIIILDASKINYASEIKIESNTFNPSQLGLNGDTRDLGLAISRIYFK